ncbi:MAG: peptidoglycan-binding domain-containing protein [Casimicrobiaceae bacterium]
MNTNHTKFKRALLATGIAFALGTTAAYATDTQTNMTTDQSSTHMSGKQKATAIGAGSGAVAGALVGGPVGAVVGAGVGAVVGHEGTDAKGHVSDTSMRHHDKTVWKAQSALNDKGFNVAVDGKMGPNTEEAVRSFQGKNGIAESGTLNEATLSALGVKS